MSECESNVVVAIPFYSPYILSSLMYWISLPIFFIRDSVRIGSGPMLTKIDQMDVS